VSDSGSAAIRSPLLRVAPAAAPGPLAALAEQLLREQRSLTAVERFARQHEGSEVPAQARYYRDLIPLERPRAGQQYAFEVDLDACTGCKACVAACHSLNGLEEDEVWRTVGSLHGGTPEAPAQQTVTTSCHHCVEPACLAGCPVKAYEKDPLTGIVIHLDDQCIGCQYCTLMCPYDAPKYSRAKGIVRKCDMCSHRLAAGEAPACVQGCPNQAIRIRIIDQAQAVEASEAGAFLSGAPAPDHTMPTTSYRSARALPANLLPADFYAVAPEHGHPALVMMLVLTQLAVGAFAIDYLLARALGVSPLQSWALAQAAFSLIVAAGALGAATFHLGRPQYAFRALLGLRTSWMSREILAFGLFAKLAALYALALAAPVLPPFPGRDLLAGLREIGQTGAVITGLGGVFSSVMIYAATQRQHWRASLTGPKFFGTTLILGSASLLALWALSAPLNLAGPARLLLQTVIVATAVKIVSEALMFGHLTSRRHSISKRVALVMVRDLKPVTILRFVCGVTGGVLVPLACLYGALPISPGAVVSALLLIAGELAERYLFFKTAPASHMPGALP
jgi:formate dehydrogenase iron-sulfur subunit